MFEVADYIGIIAFSMSGFFVAVRNKLDFLGVLISVFLTAFGGGILRDVAVDKTPYTFTHTLPAVVMIIVVLCLVLLKFHNKSSIENKPLFILSDSIGLISFSITGSLVGLEHNLNITGVLALSFVTAVGGGIIRDVIINEIPFVLKTGFYGTVALIIGAVLYVLDSYEILNIYALSIVFILGVILRVVAYYKKWYIPMV
ncbi:MAG: trimeric intracellular cation channel family protein [Epsilonproteobacteria bacterium]|nr:MAG: trimeric intracellular cation channel family protein [Campylobacterota bacterium]